MSSVRVNRRDPYELCSRCETFHLSSEMTSVPVRGPNGQIAQLRFCPSCLHPRFTYIQSGRGLGEADGLVLALAIVAVLVGLVFGLVIGDGVGVAVLITCSLCGAGILAAEAASKCG